MNGNDLRSEAKSRDYCSSVALPIVSQLVYECLNIETSNRISLKVEKLAITSKFLMKIFVKFFLLAGWKVSL